MLIVGSANAHRRRLLLQFLGDIEKYRYFKQVGLRSLNRNNEEVVAIDPNFTLMAKAFNTSFIPDTCIQCTFNGTNIADKEMHVIRNNGDKVTEANKHIDTMWE